MGSLYVFPTIINITQNTVQYFDYCVNVDEMSVIQNLIYFVSADFGSASMKSPANSFVGTPYW